jgi:hypothetical protein
MKKKPNQTEKGLRFEALAKPRGVKAGIAARLKIDNAVVNNWRIRGVPAEYAYVVAEIVKCKPDEISEVVVANTRLSQAKALLPTIDDAIQLIYAERGNLRANDLAALKVILEDIEREARATLNAVNDGNRR